MSFEALQAKVARAEDALEAHERQVAADLRVFGSSWRNAWSPPRVIAAGLATGFLAGWAQPARVIAGGEPARWLQMAGSLAGLFGSVQAAFAASQAQDAAEDAGEAAATATGIAPEAAAAASAPTDAPAAAPPPPTARRYVPDPAWEAQPTPAEAATELSERR